MYTMIKVYKGIPRAHVIMQEALEETLRGLQVKVVASDIVVYKSEQMISETYLCATLLFSPRRRNLSYTPALWRDYDIYDGHDVCNAW
jgi:hypothetical protein